MFLKLFNQGDARDPVCGTSVQKEQATTYQFIGATYYFCSARCRDRFRALPTRYLDTPIKLGDSSSSGAGCC